jgi:hypothetical protein
MAVLARTVRLPLPAIVEEVFAAVRWAGFKSSGKAQLRPNAGNICSLVFASQRQYPEPELQ